MPITQIAEFKAHPRHAQGAAFSPDGDEIATTGMDAVAQIWSASDFALLRTLEAHEKSVNAIAISPDGEIAITASSDRTAIVWDYRQARALQTLTGFRNTLAAARFSPDGRRAAVSSYDGRIGVWERDCLGLPPSAGAPNLDRIPQHPSRRQILARRTPRRRFVV